MLWGVFFFAALALFGATLLLFTVALWYGHRYGRSFPLLQLLFGGHFLSSALLFVPIYYAEGLSEGGKILRTVLLSLHNAVRIFVIDDGYTELAASARLLIPTWLAEPYMILLLIFYVTAPILTFGFLLSFFRNLSAHLRYIVRFNRDLYVFSELNERSMTLAADLGRRHKRAQIVFCDVFEQNEESSFELIEAAKRAGALCFRSDILSLPLRLRSRRASLFIFIIGMNESENINHALKLIERHRNRERTDLYVFSTRPEGELLLTGIDKGRMRVRRIDEVRSLVARYLYEQGHRIFDSALPPVAGERQINAVVVGMGSYGTEMTRALAWYCQMDGYRIRIDAFDRDALAEERFSMLCPELMSEDYNGVFVPGEAEYSIAVHSGVDVDTKRFADAIREVGKPTYVLVALGSDEENIRVSVYLRMLCERIGARPVICAIVKNTAESNALCDIKNYRGQAYEISFIGDHDSFYSEDVIIDSEVEADALARHLKWGEEEEFWRYEYNYRSSVASSVHMRARIGCGIPGAEKREQDLTEEEAGVIERLEHRRWNAYMRSEGYVYSGSPDKSSRNDLAKMHHDLVDFASLSEEEKRKDRRVGLR